MLERIDLRPETIAQFADTCKQKRVKVPKEKPVVTHTADPDVCDDADQDILRKRLEHEVFADSRRREHKAELLARLSDPKPTLSERITDITVANYHEPPKDKFFGKTAILARIEDFKPQARVAFNKIRSLGWYLEYQQWRTVEKKQGEIVWKLWKDLEKVMWMLDNSKTPHRKWTSKDWRGLFGLVKRLLKIDLEHEYDIDKTKRICTELAAREFTFPLLEDIPVKE